MKETVLSTGRAVQFTPLRMAQARRMAALFDAGKPMEATAGACLDSLNNALRAEQSPMTVEQFEEQFEIPEANEFFDKIMEASQLKMGGAKASQ